MRGVGSSTGARPLASLRRAHLILLARRDPAAPAQRRRPLSTPPRAAADEGDVVYEGAFGPWSIDQNDLVEVWTYRVGLSVTAAAFAAGTAAALLPGAAPLAAAGTAVAAAGAAGLGVSLVQIHIYVAPLKRMLQLFWAAGVAGGAYLAATHPGEPLPEVVAAAPSAVWLVGPAFAALSGVCFKEGVCYGKLEAFALTLLLPALCLAHLSGGAPRALEAGLAAACAALLAAFAARKYTQPVKDDIGDKSVFQFYALPEAEQARALAAREARRRGGGEA